MNQAFVVKGTPVFWIEFQSVIERFEGGLFVAEFLKVNRTINQLSDVTWAVESLDVKGNEKKAENHELENDQPHFIAVNLDAIFRIHRQDA